MYFYKFSGSLSNELIWLVSLDNAFLLFGAITAGPDNRKKQKTVPVLCIFGRNIYFALLVLKSSRLVVAKLFCSWF